MKNISKRGLGIAAAAAVVATVVVMPGANAGSNDNRVDGRVTFGTTSIKIEGVKGDNDEGKGYWRLKDATGAAYGRVLCVTGSKVAPASPLLPGSTRTAAIGLWIYKSTTPALPVGTFGIHYIQDKPGDSSAFVPSAGTLNCPTQGFAATPALTQVSTGDYDVKVKS